jgi:hypothetical protein
MDARFSTIWAFTALLACVLYGGVAQDAHAQLANSSWPDYGGGLTNTHRADAVGPALPGIAWSYSLTSSQTGLTYAYHQASIGSDQSIYFLTYPGGRNENLVALNSDGTLKWLINGSSISSRVGKWPAVTADGTVLYTSGLSGSTAGWLFARDAVDGHYLWTGPDVHTASFQTGPTVASNGTIYVGTDGADFRSVASNGNQNWTTEAGGPFVNPAIGNNETIYTGGSSLRAIDADGQLEWSIDTVNQPVYNRARYFTSPAIDDHGNIFVGTSTQDVDPGYLLAVDSGGQQLWTRDGVGGAPAIGADGTIYAGYQGVLHAMSPIDGHDLWTYATGPIDEFGAEGVTIDGAGNLYVSTVRGELLSLDSSGALRWSLDLAPEIDDDVYLSAPVLGPDGTLYVGGGRTRQFFAIRNVPEPSTLTLAGCSAGLAILFLARRRAHVKVGTGCDCRIRS